MTALREPVWDSARGTHIWENTLTPEDKQAKCERADRLLLAAQGVQVQADGSARRCQVWKDLHRPSKRRRKALMDRRIDLAPLRQELKQPLAEACLTGTCGHQAEAKYVRVTLEGGGTYLQPLHEIQNALDGELGDDPEVGTRLTLEVIALSECDYEALPDFDGH